MRCSARSWARWGHDRQSCAVSGLQGLRRGVVGEVPEHWEVRWLGQFGTLSKGNGGNKGDEVPSGIPCVRYGGRCRAWTRQNGCVPLTFMPACDM